MPNTTPDLPPHNDTSSTFTEANLQTGKDLILLIIGCNLFFTLITNLFLSFNLLNIIVQVALCLGLYIGIRWIRWLFILGGVAGMLLTLTQLMAGMSMPFWLLTLLLLNGFCALLSAALLLFNKHVADFLYEQYVQRTK